MRNIDSLILKFFYEENKNFLTNGVIQKIQMPKRTEILFYIRNNGQNLKFYINIDPKYPHICFIKDKEDYSIKIPKSPPMFCMQLRKYLEGAKIKECNLIEYDRILEFYFETINEFGIKTYLILAIELMGKYSNVILYDKNSNIVIGSAHNVSKDKSSIREIYGGVKYIYPKKQEKSDILKTSYSTFLDKKEDIPSKFYYFTKPFFEFLKTKTNNEEELFQILQNAVFKSDLIKEFWGNGNNINEILLNYFSKIVNEDVCFSKKNKLKKIINSRIKRAIETIEAEIDIEKFEKYKRWGDLILSYIYLIKDGDAILNTEGESVPLDINIKPSDMAQKYYKQYQKLKSAKNIMEQRKKAAEDEKKYLDEILFNIENADKISELDEIEEEIEGFISKKSVKIDKLKLETFNFKDYEIILGKNNKQNDFLIRKLSNAEDIWLHAFNCPSSHCIIKTQNGKKNVSDEVLLYAANLVKENSPLKNSKKASIIYTRRKYLKRPPDTPLGYVTYKMEKEIVI